MRALEAGHGVLLLYSSVPLEETPQVLIICC